MAVEKGNKIKVTYEGRFKNGEVFDSTEMHGGEPLEFIVGSGMLVSGFEKAVLGMNEGEEKEVTLSPEKAYGEINPEYIQEFPKERFPEGIEVGMVVGLPTPAGQIPAKITEIGEKMVKIDLNHPLAGKELIFKIKVISIDSEKDYLKELEEAHHHAHHHHEHEKEEFVHKEPIDVSNFAKNLKKSK